MTAEVIKTLTPDLDEYDIFPGWDNCSVLHGDISIRIVALEKTYGERYTAAIEDGGGIFSFPTYVWKVSEERIRFWPTPSREFKIIKAPRR